jgi:nifR3 family TIM-barrel protein
LAAIRPPLERWKPLAARGVHVDFPFFLAPMVGLSHLALRRTVRSYVPREAATLLFTEMLSSRRLPAERIGDRPETATGEEETNLVPQLLANEERFIAASLTKLEGMRPAALDINMGCPVSKALRHNWGVALMGDPAYAEDIVRTTVRLSPWPVSVKLRTGLRDDPEYLLDFCRMLEGAGAAWITLHPRIAGQHRRGSANWEYIARARDAVSIPLIGNGDVQTAEDALTLLRRTGCDGVMIGRAASARPWIFWQIGEELGRASPPGREGERAPADGYAEGQEFHRAFREFVAAAEPRFPSRDTRKRVQFFVHWGARWLDFGHELWRQVTGAADLGEMQARVETFFSQPQRMTARTELRS